MKHITLIICLLALAACFSRPDGPPSPGDGAGTGSPGDQINLIAAWATGIASLCLLIGCPILAWLGRLKLAGTVAGICITIIVGAPILGWVGDWLPWIAGGLAGVGLVVAGLAAWARRHHVESLVGIDLDRDGTIGGQPHGNPG